MKDNKPRYVEGLPPIPIHRVEGEEPNRILYNSLSPERRRLQKMHAVLDEQIRIRLRAKG